MAFNTASNTSVLTTYLIRKFIPALENELQFQKFTTKATIPQGMGNIARFNVFSSPAANTTTLTEGTTTGNELGSLTTSGTNATISEYGEFLTVTRLSDYTSVPGAREELANRLSYGAARSLDAVVRNAVDATSTVWYASDTSQQGGSTTSAVAGNMSASAVIGAAEQLRSNSAIGFTGVNGHPNRHYACIMGTKSEMFMVTEATTDRMTWAEANTDVPGASGQAKWVNGYMGSVYGTACYRSQNLTTATLTVTNDENFILGEGAVGAVSIIDADPQIYVNTASSGDIGNPYRNRHTIAWHAWFVSALIDANRVIKIYANQT